MKTFLIILAFLVFTLGPLAFLMMRSIAAKKGDQTPPPPTDNDDD